MSVELIVPSAQQTPKNLALVLSICGEALKTFGTDTISSVNVLIVLQHIIVAISKLTKLSEDDKKQLALDAIHWLIEHQTTISNDDKQALDLLATAIFPQAIELLSIEKETIAGCFSCLKK